MTVKPVAGDCVRANSMRGRPVGVVLRYSTNGRDVRLELRGIKQRVWVRADSIELHEAPDHQLALPLDGVEWRDRR